MNKTVREETIKEYDEQGRRIRETITKETIEEDAPRPIDYTWTNPNPLTTTPIYGSSTTQANTTGGV